MRVKVTVSMGQERKLGLRGVRKCPRSQAKGDPLAVGFYHSDTVEALHPCPWKV